MITMEQRRFLKRLVDIAMVVTLLLLMTYALIGEAIHEILGIFMFILMLVHMDLNISWYRALGRGRYPPYRIVQTILDFLILGSMLASAVSGVLLSKHVFSSLDLSGDIELARLTHLLASHWGFLLMSMHLGMHGAMLLAALRAETGKKVMAVLVLLAGAWGIVAFLKRGLWQYLFLVTRFYFTDYGAAVPLVLLDYLCIMILFVSAGFFTSKLMQRRKLI